MELWKAIVMGIIQGLAEFLPISSSGHLAIFKHVLNIDLEAGGIVFDVLLHMGTLAAIFVAFWADIKELIVEGFGILGDFFKNLFAKEKKGYDGIINTPYRRFVMLVIVSTIPTGVMGVLGKDLIEAASSTLIVPGICLLITAVLLHIADKAPHGKKDSETVSYKEAGLVGIAQGFATLPGISRSGTTITACRVLGFDKDFAVRYSFIMSIPAVLGAAVLELKDFSLAGVGMVTFVNYMIGTVISGVVGYICIKTMLVVVRQKTFKGFSIYCLIVGTLAIVWNFIG